jgi:adenylate kinase family enzyme
VWDCIETELQRRKEVSLGIIFTRMPKSKSILILIEKLFEERGIPVVWMNENVEERKERGKAPN